MTTASEIAHDAAIAVANSLEGLSAIHQPGCAAVVWRREPQRRFQDWIDRLDPEQLPRTRVVIQPSAARETVLRCCDIAGAPDCEERSLLADDIAALADGLAQIERAPYLRLRLDVVTTNSCRKFHIDAVTSRLICTYRGTGTQYGISEDGADPARIVTTPTGAPLILRGTLRPETPRSGLLHRSPPIAGSGETRLLLVLDPLDAMVDESSHVVH